MGFRFTEKQGDVNWRAECLVHCSNNGINGSLFWNLDNLELKMLIRLSIFLNFPVFSVTSVNFTILFKLIIIIRHETTTHWTNDQRTLHIPWEDILENKSITGQRISVYYILHGNMYLKAKLFLGKGSVYITYCLGICIWKQSYYWTKKSVYITYCMRICIWKQCYYWTKDQRTLHITLEYVFEKSITRQKISVHYVL